MFSTEANKGTIAQMQEQAQQEVLQSICDILIAGGYFRARLNIDPFDKVNIELKYNLDSWGYLLVHHW